MSEIKRMPKYWICNLCAEKKGLMHHKTGNTKVLSYCGHCDSTEEQALTPIVDLIKKRENT